MLDRFIFRSLQAFNMDVEGTDSISINDISKSLGQLCKGIKKIGSESGLPQSNRGRLASIRETKIKTDDRAVVDIPDKVDEEVVGDNVEIYDKKTEDTVEDSGEAQEEVQKEEEDLCK